MKSVSIEVADREDKGTRASRRLRDSGRLPVNLYGLGRDVRALHVDLHRMDQLMELGQHIVELDLGGETQAALVKDLQYDAIGQRLLHADLMRVDRDTPVTTNVPIRFIGVAPAVAGSIVEKLRDSVSLEILPLEIPREFVVNVGRVDVGETLTLGDIKLPESASLYDASPENVVVVNHIHHEKEPEPEEGDVEEGVEPEVIGKEDESKEDDED